jgi:hypothetical protein
VSDRERLQQIEDDLAARDRQVLVAASEVDQTLIDWTLSLGPFERLRACSRAAKGLAGWRRVTPQDR